MRVGIFGGTFDPIHVGHLIVAEQARAQLELGEVVFIPAGQPYFKVGRVVTPATHRLAMVERAVRANAHFSVLDAEVCRPGPTYTVDTLRELRSRWGRSREMYLMLGADSLAGLDTWRSPAEVLAMASGVVAIKRAGLADFDPAVLDRVAPGTSRKVFVLEAPVIGVSSTELRQYVAQGRSLRYLVPDEVEAYIREHGLYRPESKE